MVAELFVLIRNKIRDHNYLLKTRRIENLEVQGWNSTSPGRLKSFIKIMFRSLIVGGRGRHERYPSKFWVLLGTWYQPEKNFWVPVVGA